jgi:NAD(P)-dependent dehydrogenase (short-subunit alcohol dehydrogenase family)
MSTASSAQSLAGKVALVTGGASGIGRASSLAFARAGAAVAIADLDEAGAHAVLRDIASGGGRGLVVRADATREEEVAALVDRVVLELGGLDLALNNVGRGETGKSILTTTADRWDWILNVSLKSTWLAMKYEIPVMAATGAGAIVNMASIAGVSPLLSSSPAYAAAKAGVIHLTRYAARAHAKDGIRVNSVSPGLTMTPTVARWFTAQEAAEMTAQNQFIPRAAEPEEVAAAVVFLCSDGAAMITGTNVPIAGGSI